MKIKTETTLYLHCRRHASKRLEAYPAGDSYIQSHPCPLCIEEAEKRGREEGEASPLAPPAVGLRVARIKAGN